MFIFVKIIHVLSIISWMAGLLYLPRLFVYHSDSPIGSPSSETFKIMERRLFVAIMSPAMIVAWVSGLMLAFEAGYFRDGWFHGKLTAVVALTATHLYLGQFVRRFQTDQRSKSPRFFRVLNELPTMLMIVIVVLVLAKPF
jgi:putative membrane protein